MTECAPPHGHTLAALANVARIAVATDRSHHAAHYTERYDIARSAAGEALAAGQTDRRALVRAARAALAQDVADDRRHNSAGTRPRASAYWELSLTTPSPEPAIVDRVALRQIWPLLLERDRRVITALADHEDYQAAAVAMGLPYMTYCSALRRARARFLALWHDGEQPSRMWGHDRRVGVRGKPDRGERFPIHRVLRRRAGKVA